MAQAKQTYNQNSPTIGSSIWNVLNPANSLGFRGLGALSSMLSAPPAIGPAMQGLAVGFSEPFGPHSNIMKSLIDKQTKAHAEEALNTLGPDNAMKAAQQLDLQKGYSPQLGKSSMQNSPMGQVQASGGAGAAQWSPQGGLVPPAPQAAVTPQMSQPSGPNGMSILGGILGNALRGAGLAGMNASGAMDALYKQEQMKQMAQQTQNITPLAPGEDAMSRLTPEQAATAGINVYNKKLEAANKMVEDIKAQMDALEKQAAQPAAEAKAAAATLPMGGKFLEGGNIRNKMQAQVAQIQAKRLELLQQRHIAEAYRAQLMDMAPQMTAPGGGRSKSGGGVRSGKVGDISYKVV